MLSARRGVLSLRLPQSPQPQHSRTPVRYIRAKFAKEAFGIVNEVNGNSVVLAGLAPAAPASLLVTQSGSILLVGDLYTDGRIRASVVFGTPRPRERALVLQPLVTIKAGSGLLGRAIDPLGRVLDGNAPPPAGELPRRQSLLAASSPGVVERALPRIALPTGIKALDAFYPLVRGQSTAVMGECGVGKGALALGIAAHVARCNASGSSAPVRCVYVSVGRPLSASTAAFRELGRSGALSDTVFIAAPDSMPVGQRFLAPFTGAAVAEAFRDAGEHALLIVESLTAHAEAARSVGGIGAGGYGALLDRSAQLSEARGGGSLTSLVLVDTLPPGAAHTTPQNVHTEAWAAEVASLADQRVRLSPRALRSTAFVPLSFERLSGRSGHACQGEALRHYAARTGALLAQLRDAAQSVQAAVAYGVAPESDTDALMDLHAKARLLLLPTRRAIQEAADASSDAAAVALLGLADLDYGAAAPRRASGAGAAAGPSATDIALAAVRADATDAPPHAAHTGASASTTREAALAFIHARKVAAAAAASSRSGQLARPASPTRASAVAPAPVSPVAQEDEALPPPSAPAPRFGAPVSDPLAPPQLFADASKEVLAARLSSPSLPAWATLPVGSGGDAAPLESWGCGGPDAWPSAPHESGPGRLLLSLFVLAHGYVQRVPLRRLLEYEAALYAAVTAPGVGASHDEGEGGSLLGAALCAAVSDAMQAGAARLDAGAMLRAATTRLNDAARAAGEERQRAAAAAAAVAPAPAPRSRRSGGLWSWISPPAAEPAEAVVPSSPAPGAPQPDSEDPQLAAARASEAAFDGASYFVRLDPGVGLATLPRPWRLLHVVVADFTRRFCGEPLPPLGGSGTDTAGAR